MHKTTSIPSILALLGILLQLVSCNMPTGQAGTATPDAKALITEAAVTVAAQLTLSAKLTPSITPAIIATHTPQPPAPTAAVSTPISSPTPTTSSDSGGGSSPDAASFVTDVTVPDGTAALPGAVFEKTWRIKNTGTTTWSPAYSLVWVEGERMGSPDSIPLPKDVRPGETVDISVKLTAPAKSGTYQTYFCLRNASGQFFKLDGTGDLWVKIIVGLAPTATPGSATLTATLASPSSPQEE